MEIKSAADFGMKAIVSLAGLSLGINSFLVRDKVSDINDNIRAMTAAVKALEVTSAVTVQQVNTLTARDEQLSRRVDSQFERLQRVESDVAKLSGTVDLLSRSAKR